MGLYNYQPSPHWHLPSLLLKSIEGLMQQQLTLFLYRNDALHWTHPSTFASRLLAPIASQKSNDSSCIVRGIKWPRDSSQHHPPFRGSSRSPTIRKLASHHACNFRPSFDRPPYRLSSSFLSLSISIYSSSFPQCQCFSINILQFHRANWSYGGRGNRLNSFFVSNPTKTGSSSEIIVFPPHRKGTTIGLLPFRIETFSKKFCEIEGWSYCRGEEEGRRIVEGTMVFRFGTALETARLKLDDVWRHDCRKLVGEDCTHRLNSRGSRGL